jgi:hypothetical protein
MLENDETRIFNVLKDRLRIDIDEDYVPFEFDKRIHVRLMWNKKTCLENTVIDNWVELSSDFFEMKVRD